MPIEFINPSGTNAGTKGQIVEVEFEMAYLPGMIEVANYDEIIKHAGAPMLLHPIHD